MKLLKHTDLMTLYQEGVNADNYIYSEQRSNLMLVAGNHYSRKNSSFWNRVRDDRNINQDQRIRLTKNHIQRVCKIYENNILSYAPTVIPLPRNESELQDQKAAELNNAVWKYTKDRKKLKDRFREYCQDYIRVGEAAVKIFWDETKGTFLGYEQAVDDFGQLQHDEMGNAVPDKAKPKFSGELEFERIFAFNIFRAKDAKSMDESPFIGHRKMVACDDLKNRIGNDPEKLKYVQESSDETFLVFDGQNTGPSSQADQCMVMEVFIKPCMQYPKGYFYIYTSAGILWEGELPFGVYPLLMVGFDEVPTNPRCHSIIKVLRPYQAEINRAASKVAEHQITLGDDKLLIQTGTKIQNGGNLPGVRAIQFAGQPPQILQGRAGDQYVAYIENQIQEMYLVANLAEDLEERPAQLDPQTMLFMSIEQKKKYSVYVSKFERFLNEICETSLELLRNYLTPEMIIPMIGRSEFVNISEFKNTSPLNYQIKLEPGTEDMESRLGKQLMFNQVLQFVGSSLDQKTIGQLIRNNPYSNNEQMAEELTLDYDNATNMILSLDRGKMMMPNPKDDPNYMMKRLVTRMRKADFEYLSPQVKQMYQQVYEIYIEIETDQQRKIQEAAQGYIPMQLSAVPCDLYVPDPNNSSKVMRARIPTDSLQWLLGRLDEQGFNQKQLLQQQQGVLADMASKLVSRPDQPQQNVGEIPETQVVQPQIS
jgi:hypothetical protein